MNNKQELNQIFSEMLGINIILSEDTTGYDKQLFIKMIDNWMEAFDLSNEMAMKYGVSFDKIENLLFGSLESSISLMYGEGKSELILWYIYEGRDENNKPYTITNPETKQSYTLNNAGVLFELLNEIEGLEHLDIEGEDDNEDDE
jgi:hypothetical protein